MPFASFLRSVRILIEKKKKCDNVLPSAALKGIEAAVAELLEAGVALSTPIGHPSPLDVAALLFGPIGIA